MDTSAVVPERRIQQQATYLPPLHILFPLAQTPYRSDNGFSVSSERHRQSEMNGKTRQ